MFIVRLVLLLLWTVLASAAAPDRLHSPPFQATIGAELSDFQPENLVTAALKALPRIESVVVSPSSEAASDGMGAGALFDDNDAQLYPQDDQDVFEMPSRSAAVRGASHVLSHAASTDAVAAGDGLSATPEEVVVQPGDELVIRGSGFLPFRPSLPRLLPDGEDDADWAVSVSIGGVPSACEVAGASRTDVRCTVTDVATTGALSVRVGKGRGTAVLQGVRVVVREQAPHVTGIWPTEGSLLGGTALTVLGSGLRATDQVTVGGRPCERVSVRGGGSRLVCVTAAVKPPEGSRASEKEDNQQQQQGSFPNSSSTAAHVVVSRGKWRALAGQLRMSEQATPRVTWLAEEEAGRVRLGLELPLTTGQELAAGPTNGIAVSIGNRPCRGVAIAEPSTVECLLGEASASLAPGSTPLRVVVAGFGAARVSEAAATSVLEAMTTAKGRAGGITARSSMSSVEETAADGTGAITAYGGGLSGSNVSVRVAEGTDPSAPCQAQAASTSLLQGRIASTSQHSRLLHVLDDDAEAEHRCGGGSDPCIVSPTLRQHRHRRALSTSSTVNASSAVTSVSQYLDTIDVAVNLTRAQAQSVNLTVAWSTDRWTGEGGWPGISIGPADTVVTVSNLTAPSLANALGGGTSSVWRWGASGKWEEVIERLMLVSCQDPSREPPCTNASRVTNNATSCHWESDVAVVRAPATVFGVFVGEPDDSEALWYDHPLHGQATVEGPSFTAREDASLAYKTNLRSHTTYLKLAASPRSGLTCGLLETGRVRCWGQMTSDGDMKADELPLEPLPEGYLAVDVTVGAGDTACVVAVATGPSVPPGLACWNASLSLERSLAASVEVTVEPNYGQERTAPPVIAPPPTAAIGAAPPGMPELVQMCLTGSSEAAVVGVTRDGQAVRLELGVGVSSSDNPTWSWNSSSWTLLSSMGVASVACGASEEACIVWRNGSASCLPEDLPPSLHQVDDVAASGNATTVARLRNGSMLVWNGDEHRVVGTAQDSLPPVHAVSAGGDHACALVGSSGRVLCWGSNDVGQLDGQMEDWNGTALAEAVVDPSLRTVRFVGSVRLLEVNGRALSSESESTITTWELADPLLQVGGSSVVCGHQHTCALVMGGYRRCWGATKSTGHGSIGQQTEAGMQRFEIGCRVSGFAVSGCMSARAHETAVGVLEASWEDFFPGTRASSLATGDDFTCLVIGGGFTVHCVGEDFIGQLGDGDEGESPTFDSLVASIGAGWSHTCVVLEPGSIRCWGHNGFGQLGYGDTTHRSSPGPAVDLGGEEAVAVSLGWWHTCALLKSGSVMCWGWNEYGLLGSGDTTDRSSPGPAVDLGEDEAVGVSLGLYHTCVLLKTGSVRCWGRNTNGQLGYGDTTDRNSPGPAVDLGGEDAVAVSLGDDHACALLGSGSITCWGSNGGWRRSGQLGYGDFDERHSPGPAVDLGGEEAVAVALGGDHTCALLKSGSVRCWGSNSLGQLGYGDTNDRRSPGPSVDLGGEEAVVVSFGQQHSCAIVMSGAVRCWGRNDHGQLGDGTTLNQHSPVKFRDQVAVPPSLDNVPRNITTRRMVLALQTTTITSDRASVLSGRLLAVPHFLVGYNWRSKLDASAASNVLTVAREVHTGIGWSALEGVSARLNLPYRVITKPDEQWCTNECDWATGVGSQVVESFLNGFCKLGAFRRPSEPAEEGYVCVANADGDADRRPHLALTSAMLDSTSSSEAAATTGSSVLLLTGDFLWIVFQLPFVPSVDVLLPIPTPSGPSSPQATNISSAVPREWLPCSNVTVLSTSSIGCSLPPGAGRGVQVRLASPTLHWQATVDNAFDYAAPVISLLSPATVTPAGASRITIHGSGFGLPGHVQPTVLVGSGPDARPCSNLSHTSDSRIDCTAPPQYNLQRVVVHVVSQASAPAVIDYGSLRVDSVQPAQLLPAAPSSGFTQPVTVRGAGFDGGLAAGAEVRVTVAGAACTNVTIVSSAVLNCTVMPTAELIGRSVQVAIGLPIADQAGNTAVEPRLSFTTASSDTAEPAPPPSVVRVDSSSGTWPTSGSNVTITGQGFGFAAEDIVAVQLVDAGTTQELSHRWLSSGELQAEIGPGVGTSWALVVRARSGLQSEPFGISYDPPTPESVSPTLLRPERRTNSSAEAPVNASSSAAVVTLSGRNLALADEQITALIVGGTECTTVRVLSPGSSLECVGFVRPADQWPSPDTVEVIIGGQSSGAVSGLVRTIGRPSVTSASPAVVVGGDTITVLGERFGSNADELVGVWLLEESDDIGGTSSPQAMACLSNLWLSSTSTSCALPSAMPETATIRVVVETLAGNSSTSASIEQERPAVASITPEVVQVPVAGSGRTLQETFTLVGSGFIRTGVKGAAVGGLACSSATIVSDTQLRCGVDVTEAFDSSVALLWPSLEATVVQAGLQVEPFDLPQVLSVTPAVVFQDDVVTVLGLSLGSGPQDLESVIAGDRECVAVGWISPTSVTCRVAMGSTGSLVHVRLTTGAEASNNGTLRIIAPPDPQWEDPSFVGNVNASSSHSSLARAVSMPSGASGVLTFPTSLDVRVEADSAFRCGLEIVPGSSTDPPASLVGSSLILLPAGTAVASFTNVGVRAALGTSLTVRAWCESSAFGVVRTTTGKLLRLASLGAEWEATPGSVAFSSQHQAPGTAQGPFRIRVGSVTEEGDALPAALNESVACFLQVRGTSAQARVGMAGTIDAEGLMVAEADGVPTTGLALASELLLNGWCEWTPTGETIAVDAPLAFRMLEPEALATAPPVTLVRQTVTLDMAVSVSAATTASGVAALPDNAQPLCTVTTRTAGEDDDGRIVSISPPLGLARVSSSVPFALEYDMALQAAGEYIMSVECSLWSGAAIVRAADVAVRVDTISVSLKNDVTTPMALASSPSMTMQLVNPPQLRLETQSIVPRAVFDPSDVVCRVELVMTAGGALSQVGTTTSFAPPPRAQQSDAEADVPLTDLAVVATKPITAKARMVRFDAACSHAIVGALSPVQFDVEVVGVTLEWLQPPSSTEQPTNSQWEPFAVRIAPSTSSSSSAAWFEAAEERFQAMVESVICTAEVFRLGSTVPELVAGAQETASKESATARFRSFQVTAPRGASYTLQVACRFVDVALQQNVSFSFELQGCGVGRQPREGAEDLCDVCEAGRYSDGGRDARCVQCPAIGTECVNGILRLKPRFFRPARDAGKPFNSDTELHPCFNTEACVVNDTMRSYACASGYKGPLCGVCDEGFALFGQACQACWEPWASALIVVGLVLLLLSGSGLVSLRMASAASSSPPTRAPLSSAAGGASPPPARADQAAVATRQLLTHVQGLSALVTFRAKGTELFRDVVGITEGISASPLSWGPVQCALGFSYEARFWLTLLLPLLVVLLTAAMVVVASTWPEIRAGCRSRSGTGAVAPSRPWRAALRDSLASYVGQRQHVVVLVVVLFLTYMPIVGLSVRSLACQDATIGGVLYLKSDLAVECFAGGHTVVVVGAIVVGLLLVGAGLPASLIVALRGNEPHPSLEFMTRGYRDGVRWWESMVLLRKSGLVMAAALITDAPSQAAVAVLVLLGALLLQMQHRPYAADAHNTLEVVSIACMMTTVALSLLFLQVTGGEEAQAALGPGEVASTPGATDVVVTIVMLGLNLVTVGILLFAACSPRMPISCRRAVRVLRERWCQRGSVTKGGDVDGKPKIVARPGLPSTHARRRSASRGATTKATSQHPEPRASVVGAGRLASRSGRALHMRASGTTALQENPMAAAMTSGRLPD